MNESPATIIYLFNSTTVILFFHVFGVTDKIYVLPFCQSRSWGRASCPGRRAGGGGVPEAMVDFIHVRSFNRSPSSKVLPVWWAKNVITHLLSTFTTSLLQHGEKSAKQKRSAPVSRRLGAKNLYLALGAKYSSYGSIFWSIMASVTVANSYRKWTCTFWLSFV